ncbi:MAG: hypothetical protein LBK98_02520 [Peptococcaceae bacterium]|nr:hypothetical protein [Peptococcaceae bacterium]
MRPGLGGGDEKNRRGPELAREQGGSLTVEGFLVLPLLILVVLLLLAGALRWRAEVERTDQALPAAGATEVEAGSAGQAAGPARTIRNADFIVDMGYSIKELLPGWSQGILP